MIKAVTDFLTQRPLFGAAAGGGGGLAALLTHIQLITPLLGFLAAATGLLIGVLTLSLKIREVFETFKQDVAERKKKKHEHIK